MSLVSDGLNRCGHQLHTNACQNKVQAYQFNENNSNYGKYGSSPQGIREISDDLFKSMIEIEENGIL